MQWLEITADASDRPIDDLCSFLNDFGIDGLVIEDEDDFKAFLERNRQYWDYVDQELLDEKRGLHRVKFYLPDDAGGRQTLLRLRELLPDLSISSACIRDEDWENNWKRYYKPIFIGSRLLIVPEWEDIPETHGRTVMRLNPGLIFGTGSHPTTRMCLEAAEGLITSSSKVLDLGCGSGILAIAALLYGANHVDGCDIDPKAPETAKSNAALNGIGDNLLDIYAGDCLADSKLRALLSSSGGYDIIFANIVADVIISLCPSVPSWLKDGGIFICSGVIDGRQSEVEAAIHSCGLNILKHMQSENWHCFISRKE